MSVSPLTLPIVRHRSPDAVIAYRDGNPIRIRRFLADVAQLSQALPAGRHIINLCANRYRFMVGLAAAMVAGKISLLPSTQNPETLHLLTNFAQDVFCLTDGEVRGIKLPCVAYPDIVDDEGMPTLDIPEIECDRVIAYVFTSGSTGMPIPHPKTWGALVRNVRTEAEQLTIANGACHALVGTVPPQHMYGFESTVLLAMQGGAALSACQPFYPADICSAIEAVPRPRLLLSTPFHLRALLAAGVELPALDLVVSATAPISSKLVREVEAGFRAPLMEIYGCTETGQIATRRPAETVAWQLLPGIHLTAEEGRVWASGGHIEGEVALADELELIGDGRFLLRGRSADLVNIAGKRCSLAHLNHQLNSIPGVRDGIFFMPDEDSVDAVTRLTAFVVAPELDAASLMRALRERINPVFLPRPLMFVDKLPRNVTGKLPREALQGLADAQARRSKFGEVK